MNNNQNTEAVRQTVIGKVSDFVKRMISMRRERRACEKSIELDEECSRELQVKEWNGGLYICYNNVPLIAQEHLKEDAVTVVKTSRTGLKLWKEGRL